MIQVNELNKNTSIIRSLKSSQIPPWVLRPCQRLYITWVMPEQSKFSTKTDSQRPHQEEEKAIWKLSQILHVPITLRPRVPSSSQSYPSGSKIRKSVFEWGYASKNWRFWTCHQIIIFRRETKDSMRNSQLYCSWNFGVERTFMLGWHLEFRSNCIYFDLR